MRGFKKILIVCPVIIIILAVVVFIAPQRLVSEKSRIADITASYVFKDDGANEIVLSDADKASLEAVLNEYTIRRNLTTKKDKTDAIMMHVAIKNDDRIQDVILYVNGNECWLEGKGMFIWGVNNPGNLYEKLTKGF